MFDNRLDETYIDTINSLVYNAENATILFNSMSKIFFDGLDIENYTIFLLDDGDNNYYIEYSTLPGLNKYKHTLFPLFSCRPLKRLYAFGELKELKENDNTKVFQLGDEKVLIGSGLPIYFNLRVIGFIILHNNEIVDPALIKKVQYLMKQFANEIVILKRLEDERKSNKSLKSSIHILKFLKNLLKERDTDTLLHNILNTIFEALEADAACIAVKKKDKWKTPAELGLNEEILNKIKYKNNTMVTDFAQQIKQIIYLDKEQSKSMLELSELNVQIDSLICIPLVIDDKCDTIVILVNYRKEITDDLMLYIQKFAEISQTALRNNVIDSIKKSQLTKQSAKLNQLRESFIYTLETILDEV